MIIAKVVGVLSILSFVIIVVAVVTPGWSVMTITSTDYDLFTSDQTTSVSRVYISLWYARSCVTTDGMYTSTTKCLMMSFHDISQQSMQKGLGMNWQYLPFIEAEIETTLGAIAVLIGGVLAFVYSGSVTRIMIGVVAAFFLFAGGILVAMPTGRFAHASTQVEQVNTILSYSSINIEPGLPYSLIISAVGIFMTLVTFCLLAFLLIKTRARNGVNRQESQGYMINHSASPAYTSVMPYELENLNSCPADEFTKMKHRTAQIIQRV